MPRRAKRNNIKPKKTKQPAKESTVQLANRVAKMALNQVVGQQKNNSFLGDLGQWAGNSVSKIFGLGAYRLSRNSLYDSSTGSQVPFMHSTNESVVFRHREYLGDISSSTAFFSNPFSLNPGLQSTFPYLSSIASNFQEYRFRGLIVEYKSTSSTVVTGANTAMGTVSLVAQYRSDAPALTSKLAVLNEMWSVDGRPCDTFCLPIECDPKENPLKIQYIRTGALPPNQDIKMFDLAKFSVVTQGQQTAGTTIGELWISYEVELYKPVLASGPNDLIETWAVVGRTGVTSALPLGTAGTVFQDSIGLTFTSTTMSFPPGTQGTFIVYGSWSTAVVACIAPALTGTFLTVGFSNFSPNNPTNTDELAFFATLILTPDSVEDTPILTFGAAGTIPSPLLNIRVYEVNSAAV